MDLALQLVAHSIWLGVVIWGSIRLVDPGNPDNSFGLALLMGSAMTVAIYLLDWVAMLSFVLLIWLLVRHYHLPLWRSVVVWLLVGVVGVGAFTVLVEALGF